MMIFLTREEVGNIPASSSQIVFQNKLFTRGPDFAKNLQESAQKYCQKNSQNITCLLVDNHCYFSVWIEQDKEITCPTTIEPDFLCYCEESLAKFIGPIANLVCQNVLERNPQISKAEFIKTLAQQTINLEQEFDFKRQVIAYEDLKKGDICN